MQKFLYVALAVITTTLRLTGFFGGFMLAS